MELCFRFRDNVMRKYTFLEQPNLTKFSRNFFPCHPYSMCDILCLVKPVDHPYRSSQIQHHDPSHALLEKCLNFLNNFVVIIYWYVSN